MITWGAELTEELAFAVAVLPYSRNKAVGCATHLTLSCLKHLRRSAVASLWARGPLLVPLQLAFGGMRLSSIPPPSLWSRGARTENGARYFWS